MQKHAGKKSYDLFYGQWSISKANKISSVFIINDLYKKKYLICQCICNL